MIRFYHPAVALLTIPLNFIIIYYLKPKGIWKSLHAAIKLVTASIILLSIASPYTVVEHPGLTGFADITIIADNTASMGIFNASTSEEVYSYLENRTQVSIDRISGMRSPIGDHIIRNLRSGSSTLLISDGNNNEGRDLLDAINFAGSLNATVYLLRQEPLKKDMSISLAGDPVAILDTPSDFHIDVFDIGELEGDLEVRVDNTVVFTGHAARSMRIPLRYLFNTPGSHTMRAEIFTGKEDAFPQNNVFYRSIHVIPRPRILLISRRSSPLSRMLNRLYSVDVSSNITDPASYMTVVLDDIGADELTNRDTAVLSDFVANGGGIVVTGGEHAYTDYFKRPLLEQILPLKAGGAPQTGKSAGIVLIVDISGSTGDLYGIDPKLGVEKGLAIQMLDSMAVEDFFGVIAFNNAPHVVVPFARYQDRTDVKDTIAQLRYGGTTHLSDALVAAHDMLLNFDGGRNVIVISDGIVSDGEASLKAADSMKGDGVTVYAVGVGEDEEFMKKLAAAGGGGYLRRDQAHGIELLFGEMRNKEQREGFPLLIINSGHFITKDVILNATIYGYNQVFAKQNSQTLIMTGNGNPVISTWRFGLGRVISIATDNGNAWAPSLYDSENSKVIQTSINYAIGNPAGLEIQAQDGELGNPVEVRVSSDREPDIRFDGEQIQFHRTGERQFSASIVPESTGFHDLSGYTIAVNEASEYRVLGNNRLIAGVVAGAGGQVYNRSEIDMLIPDIKNKKTGMVTEEVDLKPLFLFAALLLYSIEVIIRRLFLSLNPSLYL